MTPVQKAIGAIFAMIGTIGGAVWVCMSIIDRNDANVRERARVELTVQGMAKDHDALNSREWQHWDLLNAECKTMRSEILGLREKLLTLELKPK